MGSYEASTKYTYKYLIRNDSRNIVCVCCSTGKLYSLFYELFSHKYFRNLGEKKVRRVYPELGGLKALLHLKFYLHLGGRKCLWKEWSFSNLRKAQSIEQSEEFLKHSWSPLLICSFFDHTMYNDADDTLANSSPLFLTWEPGWWHWAYKVDSIHQWTQAQL